MSWRGRVVAILNLSYSVTPEMLRDKFDINGALLRVDIEVSKAGKPNGLAFLEYDSKVTAEVALQYNMTEFMGRAIRVRISERPPRELVKIYEIPFEQRFTDAETVEYSDCYSSEYYDYSDDYSELLN